MVNGVVRIVLASGLLCRADSILLVRGRYEGERDPLWTLPGGRQQPGERLGETIAREFEEEASLAVRAGSLAYVSESVDETAALHVLNCTFWVCEDEAASPRPQDPNIVEARFVPRSQAPALLRADVLRIPVAAALEDRLEGHYFSFHAGNTVVPFFSPQT